MNRIVNYRKGVPEYTMPEYEENLENSKILLRFDESATKDECGNTWTAFGTLPEISSDVARLGKAAFLGGNCALQMTSAPIGITGSNFTIDFWVYLLNADGGVIIGAVANGTSHLKLGLSASGIGINPMNVGNNEIAINWILPTYSWHHVAVVRDNYVVSFFLDGQKAGSVTHYFNYTAIGTILGCTCNHDLYPNCYIDEFRVSTFARWTENFTPPELVPLESTTLKEEQIKFYRVPAETPRLVLNGDNHTRTYAALVEPKIAKINKIFDPAVVLMHFDDVSDPGKDECGNGWAVNGSAVLSETNAKFGKAFQFQGSQVLNHYNGFSLGGRDFTIDFWCCITGATSTGDSVNVLRVYEKGGSYKSLMQVYVYGEKILFGNAFGGNEQTLAKADLFNKLIHIAAVYEHGKSTMKIFVNGTLERTMTGVNISRTVCVADIGANGTNYASARFYGTIDELRIIESAMWLQDFTPPTEPYEVEELILVDTGEIIDNPIASDIDIRLGTGDEDVKRIAKRKKTPTLILSETSLLLSAGQLSRSFTYLTDSDGEVIVTSNNPDIVSAKKEGNKIVVSAMSDSGSAIVSVQIAESAEFEESATMTVTVGNYIFGALNTCTPNEIQAVAKLGIGTTTWAEGDSTAEFTVEKFQVGGSVLVQKISVYGVTEWKYTYSEYYSPKEEHAMARIIGFNHNSALEGNNTIHFMMWSTWAQPMAFIDNGNYDNAARYTSMPATFPDAGTYRYTTTHHKGGTAGHNNVGWTDSIIRTRFLPAFINALPSDWRNVLTYCTKYTYHPDSNAVTAVTDRAFILSTYEIFGSSLNEAYDSENAYQSMYTGLNGGAVIGLAGVKAGAKAAYETDATQPKSRSWALRSPYVGNDTQFCAISDAIPTTTNARSSRISLGIVPCFVVA